MLPQFTVTKVARRAIVPPSRVGTMATESSLEMKTTKELKEEEEEVDNEGNANVMKPDTERDSAAAATASPQNQRLTKRDQSVLKKSQQRPQWDNVAPGVVKVAADSSKNATTKAHEGLRHRPSENGKATTIVFPKDPPIDTETEIIGSIHATSVPLTKGLRRSTNNPMSHSDEDPTAEQEAARVHKKSLQAHVFTPPVHQLQRDFEGAQTTQHHVRMKIPEQEAARVHKAQQQWECLRCSSRQRAKMPKISAPRDGSNPHHISLHLKRTMVGSKAATTTQG